MNVPERTYARVDTALKGYLRILPTGRLTSLFACTQSEAMPRLSETAQSALPDGLAHYLRAMNEKLSAILSILTQQTLQEDFPVPVLIHDISGAGIRFSADQEFELGQGVEVVIALNNQPQNLAGTIGTILRAEENKGERVWAMEFKNMRDCEREKIIQYVVAKQREQLLERHLAPSS
ncbi:PilZ domain-containing protein [Desulfomicrobium norvegicum]|uniref:PilZ domain-containing protein n=1 Tax=Desulfomicrobium norvegicum (strain DSM 1741 / NCIMB 8310) TaxID=52561 RepID=A0A8G2C340_DESNO|nr:PilZ domain-containing protein [Desulfomicrobium norvegicum]SFL76898.1 PilZ domain-containing protein [Desulfomicrobium norvegicum]